MPWWAVIRGVERGGFGDQFDVLVRVRLAKIGLLGLYIYVRLVSLRYSTLSPSCTPI